MIKKLRFEEFVYSKPWQEVTFKSLAEIKRGASPRPITDSKWFDATSEIGWLRISDVTKSNVYVKKVTQFLSSEGVTKSVFLKPGNLILSIAASVGKPIINAIPLCIHDGFVTFKNLKSDTLFTYYLLDGYRNKWENLKQPGTQFNINAELLNSLKVVIPEMEEQKKIAEFFTLLDARIGKQEDKIAALKEQKKGYVQKIFDQELRFKADDGSEYPEWETFLLGDILNEIVYSPVINPELVELLTVKLYAKGVVPTGNFPKPTVKGRPYYKRKNGELLIGRQNFHNGGLGIVDKTTDGLLASNAISGYQLSRPDLHSLDFIMQYLSRPIFYNNLDALIGGTGAKEMNRSEFKKIALTIPTKEEQLKISYFVRKIDERIDIENSKLDLLKEQKKGYLQQIFA